MAYSQPISTYSDTLPQRRVITDVVSIIDPSDAPAIENLGGLDGAAGKFRFTNGQSTKFEWLEDTLAGLSTILSGSIASAATVTGVVVSDGTYFQKGHLAAIYPTTGTTASAYEVVWVSSVNSNSLTVTRNIAGTQASATDSAAISIVGMARVEGADSDSVGLTSTATNSNFTAIFHKEIKVSRTMQQISQYGIADELAYQSNKAVPELMRDLEKNLLWVSGNNSGSSTAGRVMGGFGKFITTNTIAGTNFSTPSNVQSIFENAVKLAYTSGGTGPWKAFVSPTNYQRIKNVYDNSAYVMVNRTENTVGMVINSVMTPFGTVDLVLDRWAWDKEIYIVDPAHAGMVTLYPFTQESLAKTGDFERAEVVGEFSFACRQNAAHAKIQAIT